MTDSPPRPPRTPMVLPGEIRQLPRDMTAILAADVTLGAAQRQLAEHDQWLPVDGHPDQPLGQLVEENSTGALRLGYGAWRDLLLGVQFHNGEDQLISAGGITMKNVAGYDLTKLTVGQYGVFAQVVTLAMRTYRRPGGALHATFPPSAGILDRMLATAMRPQWSLLTPEALLLGYLGNDARLEFHANVLAAGATPPTSVDRTTLDADIALRQRLWAPDEVFSAAGQHSLLRISLPPSRLFEFLGALRPATFIAEPAFGVIRLFDTPPESVAGLLRRFAARASWFDGQRLLNLNVTPAEQQLLGRLKSAFDPGGRLTPLEFLP